MRVVQAVFGVFHHFELAREMERRGHLTRIYSTYPWRRLKREGLAHDKVETFPWLHTTQILLQQRGLNAPELYRRMGLRISTSFDAWTLRRIPPCDAFIAISGAGLLTGRHVQSLGGKFFCDRGSSHVRHRTELVREEHDRWAVPWKDLDDAPCMIEREEAIYDAADAITVPSTYARDTFLSRGIPTSKLHVLPYGVLLDRFQKIADPDPARFDVLYVGRVHLPKGIQYLLEAFQKLSVPNKHLTVIGGITPEMPPFLKRLPTESVTFLGTVPQTELKGWMSRSHVMVMPSLDEGMALVQGQALACGCPVIATTNSGGSDLLTEGVDGFIVPVRDPAALTERMEYLAAHPDLRDQMGRNALEKVKHLGGWRQYGDNWEHLLQQVTGKT